MVETIKRIIENRCCVYIPPKNLYFIIYYYLLNDDNIFNVLYDNNLKYNELGNCIIFGDLNFAALIDYIDVTIDSEDIDFNITYDVDN